MIISRDSSVATTFHCQINHFLASPTNVSPVSSDILIMKSKIYTLFSENHNMTFIMGKIHSKRGLLFQQKSKVSTLMNQMIKWLKPFMVSLKLNSNVFIYFYF